MMFTELAVDWRREARIGARGGVSGVEMENFDDAFELVAKVRQI